MKFCTWMTTSFFAFRLAIASPMGRILPKSSSQTHGDEPDHLENCEYAQNGSVSRGLDDVELDDTYSLLLEVSRRISTIAEADSDQFFDASESIVWSDNGCWNPNEGTLLNDEDTLLNDEDTIMNDEETPLIDENPPLNDGALENTQNPEETQEMVPPKPPRPPKPYTGDSYYYSEVEKLLEYHKTLAFLLHAFKSESPHAFQELYSKSVVPRDINHVCNSHYRRRSFFKLKCKEIWNMEYEAHRLIMS